MVPSGEMRPRRDEIIPGPDADADADADVSSDSAVLRVIILSRREYCCISFSSLLMKGGKVCGCAGI